MNIYEQVALLKKWCKEKGYKINDQWTLHEFVTTMLKA